MLLVMMAAPRVARRHPKHGSPELCLHRAVGQNHKAVKGASDPNVEQSTPLSLAHREAVGRPRPLRGSGSPVSRSAGSCAPSGLHVQGMSDAPTWNKRGPVRLAYD